MESNPFRTSRRRRIRRVDTVLMSRRHHQDAALPEQTRTFGCGRDASKLRARDIRDAVMLRKRLVQERVVGAPDLDRIAILAQLTQEKQFRLMGQIIA